MRRLEVIVGALVAALGATSLGATSLGATSLGAQGTTGTIRGRVTVDTTQVGLSGATVTFGARATLTRDDGSYVITGVTPGTDTVRARLFGYAPSKRSLTVAAGQTVVSNFTMAQIATKLTEIVSTGYGTQRAGSVTGAVTQVSSDEFNTGRIVSPEQLIESKVAGVQVVDNNEPGGGMSIRIRGATSINASSDPLYVVDGLPIGAGGGISAGRDPLNFLNPNDIESITRG